MKTKTFLMAAVTVLMAAACNKEQNGLDLRRTIAIDPVVTRATETDFEAGDKVGLTITRGSEVYASNQCMTHDGNRFTSDLYWYTEGEQTSKFVAYYPYASTIPSTFSVAADQSGEGYGSSDLMSAVKTDVVPQGSVTMLFKHMMTRVVVEIDNQVGAAISNVSLQNAILSSTVDFDNQTVSLAEGTAQDITMHTLEANSRYCAIVVPQTVGFKLSFTVNGEKTITKKLNQVTLKAGGQYTIKAVVVAGDVTVSMSGEIQNWSDEGLITEKEITFNEYDDYFEYDGVNYTTKVLPDGKKWMTQNLCFIPEGKNVSSVPGDGTGIWYPYSIVEGVAQPATDEATIKANGYLYDYKTLLNASEITAENLASFEGTQGICPKGWHIPTRSEYFALCGNSNRSAYLDEPTGTKTDETACFYDVAFSAGTVVKFNEGGFNYPLVGTIANNKYMTTVIDDSKTDVSEYIGKPAMTYLATSSPNSATQFFGMMTTFTTTNKKGKVSLSYATIASAAVSVRCVKD